MCSSSDFPLSGCPPRDSIFPTSSLSMRSDQGCPKFVPLLRETKQFFLPTVDSHMIGFVLSPRLTG